MTEFDIVIPLGPNDVDIIAETIRHTRENVVGFRNLYIVSFDGSLQWENAITIDESIFPFTIQSVADRLGGHNRNTGWFLQQLLKLYAVFVIPDILPNVLIIDSDTLFMKPTTFFEKGLPLYNVGTEYHIPYFHHLQRLHPSLTKQNQHSGICHHMLFQKHIVQECFDLVDSIHHEPFYETFLKCVDPVMANKSGASEYEMIFVFLHIYHPGEFKIRFLEWTNQPTLENSDKYHYISSHWYMRRPMNSVIQKPPPKGGRRQISMTFST